MRNNLISPSPQAPFAPGYSWNQNGNDNYNWGNQGLSQGQGQGGGGLAGDLGSIFGMLMGNSGYKNPADAAMPYFDQMTNPADAGMKYLQQIPGSISPYADPYIKSGQNASNVLQGQYQRNINDPTSVMNQIGNNFQQSPGYNFQKQQMTEAANNAAASGGFIGSPQAQQQMAQNIGGLANQDYWNYENHGLNQYNQGLQGMQGINQLGYGASTNMMDQLARALSMQGQFGFQGAEDMNQMRANQAQLAYAGQSNKNQNSGGTWGAIGNLVGDALPFLSSFL